MRVQKSVVVVGVFLVLGMPEFVWSQEQPGEMAEAARARRIEQLTKQRDKIRQELRDLQKQPEGVSTSIVPRSEFTEQPTRNMKESLESLPGVSARQNQSGRDIQLSIRGSK